MLNIRNNRRLGGVLCLIFVLVLSMLNSWQSVCAQTAVRKSSGKAKASNVQKSAEKIKTSGVGKSPGKVKASDRVETYKFVYDPSGKGGMESGVVLVRNAENLLYRGYSYAADAIGLHDHWYSRPLSAPILLIALPSPNYYVHEYIGHGSVIRDLGYRDIRYRYNWSTLNESAANYARSDLMDAQGTNEEKILSFAGGLSSSQLYLLDAEKEMYRTNKATLIFAKAVQIAASDLGYLATSLKPNHLGDGSAWTETFELMHNNDAVLAATYAKKAKTAVERADMMNPALYWTAVMFLHYFWTGDDSLYAPMLPVAGLKFAFSPKVNLTPLGAENYYYFFVNRNNKLLSLYYRTGEAPEGNITGYGVEFGPINIAGVALTPGYDTWSLPSVAYLKYSKSGYNAQLKLDVPLYRSLGLTGKAAYKTKGYILGLPLGDGPYGYAGATLTF